VGRRPPPSARRTGRADGVRRRRTGSVLAGRSDDGGGILRAAGFADIGLTDVDEPIYYGPDTTAALDWVRGFASTNAFLKRLDPAAAARALARLRDALGAGMSDEGVWFNSRAWIVIAHRR
jgi:hypothetical protein